MYPSAATRLVCLLKNLESLDLFACRLLLYDGHNGRCREFKGLQWSMSRGPCFIAAWFAGRHAHTPESASCVYNNSHCRNSNIFVS